ncbi:hypothetical protein DKM44_13635 [Deinococcus irradiatisoli]|uniref:Uncharacterized protein n=1 Tax=Deinococcus irradiatisoli TaxID=2202254 RepID=A0A2Z3JMX6_9DEIO|nr:hypothetical protein [Deinococcus irradiatisoli]AWN24139.1 hypothetical protein DKM44_13635 [Deinococcus irradiatisoli]
MKPFVLTILCAALLQSSAGALQAIVWDRDLQTKLGYGEVVGSKLNLELVSDYSGPVVVLFARDSSEKTAYNGLASRYDGLLKNGQLTIDLDSAQENVTFSKFLSSFKLSLSLQSAGQNVSLPGLKVSPGKDNKK